MSDHEAYSKELEYFRISKINKKLASSQEQPSGSAADRVPEEKKKKFKNPSVTQGLMAIVKSSWLNVLLICIPFGWASHFVWSPTVTFIFNFIAIIPLAKLLGFVTEDIALRTGEVQISIF